MIELSPPITGYGLLVMGFRLDESHGHPVYIRDVPSDVEDCYVSLHLVPIPEGDGEWIAELWNWQTMGGARVCGPEQRVAIPRPLRVYRDVRQLCKVLSDRW